MIACKLFSLCVMFKFHLVVFTLKLKLVLFIYIQPSMYVLTVDSTFIRCMSISCHIPVIVITAKVSKLPKVLCLNE